MHSPVKLTHDIPSHIFNCLSGPMDKAMVWWSEDRKFESPQDWYRCTVHFWTQKWPSATGLGCLTQPGLLGLVSTPGLPKFISLRRLITAGSAIIYNESWLVTLHCFSLSTWLTRALVKALTWKETKLNLMVTIAPLLLIPQGALSLCPYQLWQWFYVLAFT